MWLDWSCRPLVLLSSLAISSPLTHHLFPKNQTEPHHNGDVERRLQASTNGNSTGDTEDIWQTACSYQVSISETAAWDRQQKDWLTKSTIIHYAVNGVATLNIGGDHTVTIKMLSTTTQILSSFCSFLLGPLSVRYYTWSLIGVDKDKTFDQTNLKGLESVL